MITTTYTCDRCGSEQNNFTQFWKLGVAVAPLNGSFPQTPEYSIHVCRKCCEELGVLPSLGVTTKKPEPPPTVEDLIREIIERVTQ